jgi:hypothetical protein
MFNFMWRRAVSSVAPPIVACALALGVLSCGDSDKPAKQTTSTAARTATTPVTDPLPSGAVARVGTALITKASYEHWLDIARRASGAGSSSSAAVRRELKKQRNEQVMEFLLTERWLSLEAAERGITVSQSEVEAGFEREKRASFPGNRGYKRYQRKSGIRDEDAVLQVRLNLLSERLQKAITGGRTTTTATTALQGFNDAFRSKWRERTACAPQVTMVNCGHVVTVLPAP